MTTIARTGQTFASGMTYRASGAMKYMLYGDNSVMNVTLNSKMQPATFTIAGKISKTYTYNDDGTLRFSSDSIDHRFDRSYGFDHVGRLKTALSGAEARGEGTTTNRPYNQTYRYNAFGQLTQRTVKTWWTVDNSMSVTYVNNREQGSNFQYDADGRVLVGNGGHLYDAAGREIFLDTSGHGTVAMDFDGDGRQIKTVETSYDAEFNEIIETKHYVRSTVLGGQVLAEVNLTTSELRRFVYAGPTVLAWIYSYPGFESVTWEQRDPSGATERGTGAQELDPLGADAGTVAASVPPTDGPLISQGTSYSPANPNITYSFDGIRVSANDFMNFAGMAFQDPLNLMEWFARTNSGKKKGSRRSGVSWGKPFEVIYDANDKIVSINWGEYDPELRNLNFGATTSIYSNEGIPDLTLIPQNRTNKGTPMTDVEIATFRVALAELLEDQTCKSFVEGVLSQIGEARRKAFSENALDIFDEVTKLKGWGWRNGADMNFDHGEGGSYVGDTTSQPAYINISRSAPRNYGDSSSTAFVGRLVIHELFHVGSRAERGFSHWDMFKAAYSVAQSLGLNLGFRKPTEKDPGGRDPYNSQGFEDLLFNACQIRKVRGVR